ncbi:hypothetical protein CC78DRAFT_577396 [Lojkania enalia]|uniref:Uncharacterized protein n=1 Tax=Lojkania enalia TaxID=147567 RepID=A0A9P4KGD1_9PLEO|nr:hypothetical protein CC78DRAFT_577396 [Didymosphaeria enalia]
MEARKQFRVLPITIFFLLLTILELPLAEYLLLADGNIEEILESCAGEITINITKARYNAQPQINIPHLVALIYFAPQLHISFMTGGDPGLAAELYH